ncbi:lectin BRA-3-like [Gigantopelta aegis]|uniref:lectin BRA-3-like n=1 Tax=Gigantopelta aegis TaxID=1735272 RepID=UPI001B88D460|nr:lectin BRA-3-like [Gigantopelta aegis]
MCMANGAYLAEIASPEENNFVAHLVKQNHPTETELWIGGTDTLSEGHWMWTHSETLIDYQNWVVDEPNNKWGQNCLAIQTDGLWDDYWCNKVAHGVCEKRKSEHTDPGIGK